MGACTSISAVQLLAMAFTFLLALLSLDLFWVRIPEEIRKTGICRLRWEAKLAQCPDRHWRGWRSHSAAALGQLLHERSFMSSLLPAHRQRATDPDDIGVWRKIASRAAMSSDMAMPLTQAAHPNVSKISPSTALPTRPPKK
jgi:hypothetical protein